MINAISLFSGAGGMDVGFQAAGAHVVLANEIDNDASNTYKKNNPDTRMITGDIRVAKNTLVCAVKGKIDLIFGGPPCQGFSVAGKMDPSDSRSKLMWEYLDVVELIRPEMFVIENVKALGVLEKWENIRSGIIERIETLGYTCFYKVLNAADYGVPQNRERVFFIGFLGEHPNAEEKVSEALVRARQERIVLRHVLSSLPKAGTSGNPITCVAKISMAANPVLRQSPYAGMLFNGMGRPLNLNSQANTLPASMGGNKTPIIDDTLLVDPNSRDWIREYHQLLMNGEKPTGDIPVSLRRITITEAAAIQTFPADYQFCGEKSSVYRQIGNAVPCRLAKAVASAVFRYYNERTNAKDMSTCCNL